MILKILLVMAILIQLAASSFAVRLIRTTRYNSIWILCIVGFSCSRSNGCSSSCGSAATASRWR